MSILLKASLDDDVQKATGGEGVETALPELNSTRQEATAGNMRIRGFVTNA